MWRTSSWNSRFHPMLHSLHYVCKATQCGDECTCLELEWHPLFCPCHPHDASRTDCIGWYVFFVRNIISARGQAGWWSFIIRHHHVQCPQWCDRLCFFKRSQLTFALFPSLFISYLRVYYTVVPHPYDNILCNPTYEVMINKGTQSVQLALIYTPMQHGITSFACGHPSAHPSSSRFAPPFPTGFISSPQFLQSHCPQALIFLQVFIWHSSSSSLA